MKILSVLTTAGVGSAGDCVEQMFVRLMEEGHEVHAVAVRRGPLTDRLAERGVRMHLHPGLAVIDGRRLGTVEGWAVFLGSLLFSVWFLGRLMGRLRIDVVHTNGLLTPAGAMAAALTGRPHVWHVREILLGCGALRQAYLRWVCLKAGRRSGHDTGAVVAVSEHARKQFPADLRGRVQVIYDGLEDAAWTPDEVRVRAFRAQFPADALLVGVVGRIRWDRTGQEVLVRAAAMLQEKYPQARFVFVGTAARGEQEQERRLRELIAVYGLQQVVTMVSETGMDAAGHLASVYAALDVLVAPQMRAEALERGVLGAMAVGTAVVGSRTGGVDELVAYGETGLLFPVSDFEQLARELEILLDFPETRARLAGAAKAFARERFPLEKTLRKLVAVFERLDER